MVAMSFGAPIIAADGRLVAADALTLTPEQEQQFTRWLVVEGHVERYVAPGSVRRDGRGRYVTALGLRTLKSKAEVET